VPDTLLIMAKYPAPGRVKTRLAAEVGDQPACDLYRAFLEDIARRLTAASWSLTWAMTPPRSTLRDILGDSPARYVDQRGNDLGTRMFHAFADSFQAGAGRVVMIGADTPQLSPSDIRDAFALLRDGADVVLVPSRDGGYCLVALREPHDLFSSVEMGTPHVLATTRDLCRSRGLDRRELPARYDIDTLADVRALAAEIDRIGDLRATRRVLGQWIRNGILDAPG
jgi:rSAM/selenodomain-associated transferase 1